MAAREEPSSGLARRLGTADAVVVGLGSMIGAGVFAAFGPAAAAAGPALLAGLVVAAFVALCNATSSAQLAALYPESGGTYVYGARRLGPFWGYLAGWGFVSGKLASCAAMAATFGAYVYPEAGRGLGVAAVVALTSVNYRGVRKTAGVTRVVVAVVLASLAAIVVASLGGGTADAGRLLASNVSASGVLRAAGLLFFAFAGYARIATLGEEVVDPGRVIPRAIVAALAITTVVYAVVGASALAAVGAPALAGADAPLAAAAAAGTLAGLAPVARVGAAVASLGVLLSLLAGVGRTALAMARRRDLPSTLAAVHPRFGVPHRAEVAAGVVVCLVVATTDVRASIGFSSFTVLVYYAIANASAITLRPAERRYPRWLAVVGMVACAALALSLPASSVLGGIGALAAGVVIRVARGGRGGPERQAGRG